MSMLGFTGEQGNLPAWMRNIELNSAGTPEQMAAQAVVILLEKVEKWHDAVAGIDQTLFTVAGYALEKAKLAEQFKEDLAQLESTYLKQLLGDIGDLQAQALKEPSPLSDAEKAMLPYIWQTIPHDNLLLESLHSRAVEEGEYLVAHAIENLPMTHPIRIDQRNALPKDVLDGLKAKRLLSASPNSSQLATVNMAAESIEKLTTYLHEEFAGKPESTILIDGKISNLDGTPHKPGGAKAAE